ncbi:glycosyltransferase family 4 protein [Thermoleptolyngbya oregonensis NK1-22]|uniref:Glycosyltransferase family 4 protein n=1 Tax=Thermoleptolyngbya oregonensis NK1-22 TaxID=2547457 RepID=A0AA96Y747_9CYAN|nr:glycosyltransferase family 4 protein [Thermoleptolyngbya oregonensis]WOB43924.1 glycosyltransferase family 4 protein [Thermoleptolyngbya oregonensis NK1-22]
MSLKSEIKIYIPVFSSAAQSKEFSLKGENPGVGGTEFIAIKLAIEIAKLCPDLDVVLVSESKIQIKDFFVQQLVFENPRDFFRFCLPERQSLIISCVSLLRKVDPDLIKNIKNKLICWSHHPFDVYLREITDQVDLEHIVCVGVYQFYSNKSSKSNIYHIQNIFGSSSLEKLSLEKESNCQNINIVSLGALIPGKSFVEVAKAWNQLKKQIPGVKLHVIGSASTYGSKLEFDLVPASPDYAKEILKYIPENDIQNGEVIFHGNLGEEKFDIIKQCDLAILNPTGFTEAFPASPLECMACGVPVIASDDYGMSDCMRFFPELVINGHQNIAERAEWLLEDPLRYRELQQRSISVAQWFASQKDQIITRWIRLIEAVAEGKTQELRLDPVMPFYGSKTVLIYRRDIRPKLAKLNSYRREIMGHLEKFRSS